jgi:biopolymer transport protein ExbB/TolQ|tara:strand:+ start:2616 stop:2900 length:285 start_codon:yes stop_codon:yes gene_type:complete
MNKPLGQDSSLNISLPMIFQIVGIISAFVWGYGELNGRISFLEYQVRINEEHIEAIVEDAKESQNAEIPADIRQNEKIRVLEKEVEKLRNAKRN